MTENLAFWVFSIIIGALGRRIAGGWGHDYLVMHLGVDPGTQARRLTWGAMLAMLLLLNGKTWQEAGLLGLSIAIGSAVFGFGVPWEKTATGMLAGRAPGIGPNPPTFTWDHDMACLLWHGVGGMLLASVVVAYFDGYWWMLLTAGALCPCCYEYAWGYTWNIPWLGCLNRKVGGTLQYDPPPTAELIWGGIIGAVVPLL